MEQIVIQYPLLFDFLNKFFNEDAYEDYLFAENASDLVEEAVSTLLQEGSNTKHVKQLQKELNFFIHTPIEESLKEKSLHDVLKVELMDLKPLEFIRFLSYSLVIEQWKNR